MAWPKHSESTQFYDPAHFASQVVALPVSRFGAFPVAVGPLTTAVTHTEGWMGSIPVLGCILSSCGTDRYLVKPHVC